MADIITKNIGGDRLGSGAKMNVDLHTYNRSTHDLSYTWRSTMSPGTLVPFLIQPMLPGDTWDIELNADVLTHPTTAPLFGSFKLQLDVFQAPVRLYNSWLHNNRLGIGLKMKEVKLPMIRHYLPVIDEESDEAPSEQQINPSSLLAYLGIRSGYRKAINMGAGEEYMNQKVRQHKSALGYLAYFDIYKNYYANKQEEVGYIIHSTPENLFLQEIVYSVRRAGNLVTQNQHTSLPGSVHLQTGDTLYIQNVPKWMNENSITLDYMEEKRLTEWFSNITYDISSVGNHTITCEGFTGVNETYIIRNNTSYVNPEVAPKLVEFNLEKLDDMRDFLLKQNGNETVMIQPDDEYHDPPYTSMEPYVYPLIYSDAGNKSSSYFSQEGLLIKTYQSDIFNNWINTDWIDGVDGITAITNIDVSNGYLSIDSLNLAKKVYDMLNRIAVSGGTYKDWLETVYTHDLYQIAETPIYEGGLSKEVVFSEVVSNSSGTAEDGSNEPLGTLAGKGHLGSKHKGGKLIVRANEHSMLIGIVSLTPRIDYSQGNEWFTNLETMDDFHKPALDGIGFQELITEQFAGWDRIMDASNGSTIKFSAGKQPAWINYMTNYNRVFGNFALQNNEMFMTLNRRYEYSKDAGNNSAIGDLTTYIDPSKFNYAFAQTDLSSQNFWVQIAADITARRKMSAKIIPNL